MSNDAAAGFWSYTHEDDILDGGNILRLSRLIMDEYDLLSGEPLDLFVDRNDLAWGQQWRLRIDSSIAETTFFIPIITPRYFKSPECRRELLEFAAKATMLGAQELLLPILYIETPGLSADSSDEAVALVARMQHVDWRLNRLLDPQTQEYRTAVNALAQRLITIARGVAAAQFRNELDSDLENADSNGVTDIVTEVEALLPDWLDAVMGEKSVAAQIRAVWNQYSEQMLKLRRRSAPPSALLSTQIRLAREMLPLAERGRKDAQVYLARSVQLDPLISALVRVITQHPDSFPLAGPVREAIDEAMEVIRRIDEAGGDEDLEHTVQYELIKMSHLGRIFQQCNAAFAARWRDARSGNEIVRRWNTELTPHTAPQSEQDSS